VASNFGWRYIEVIMHGRTRFVAVIQVPESLDELEKRDFYREFESCSNLDRPAVVLDCSKLRQMDKNAIHLALHCLEEAMKRNGDVKLAALNPDARVVLKSYALDHVFEIFATINDALESFCRPGSVLCTYPEADEPRKQLSDNAA
jgi:anti-sigma B factor antagonist